MCALAGGSSSVPEGRMHCRPSRHDPRAGLHALQAAASRDSYRTTPSIASPSANYTATQ